MKNDNDGDEMKMKKKRKPMRKKKSLKERMTKSAAKYGTKY